MIKFDPEELICEVKDLPSDIDSLIEHIGKMRTMIKMIDSSVECHKSGDFLLYEDFTNQIDFLYLRLTDIELRAANLKAKINYLTRNKN